MKATFLKGVALGAAVSLVTLAATAAFAGTGVGKVFNLGEDNRANARSQLEGATPSAVLNVTNTDKSATASGVSIDVPGSDPPLVVNSSTKVKNLNADLLDGHQASSFQSAVSAACPNGTAIASMTPNGSTTCSGSTVFSIDEHLPPTGPPPNAVTYQPSSLTFGGTCTPTSASFGVGDNGAAPATLSYSGDNGGTTFEGNLEIVAHSGGPAFLVATQDVGQFIYFDQTTVATMNLSAVTEGMDGCEFHGTIDIAPRS